MREKTLSPKLNSLRDPLLEFKPYKGPAFRYRSFDIPGAIKRKSRMRLEEIVVDGKFWFSLPSALNDVHEFNPDVIVDSAALRKHFRKKLSEKERLGHRYKSSALTELMQQQNEHIKRNPTQSLITKLGICSLSKRGTLHTQWAYYGNNHTGYAIEITTQVPELVQCYEVIYTDTRPVIHVPKALEDGLDLDEVMRIALTKSKEWEKEDEVRLIANAPGLRSMKHLIRRIIFGARADRRDTQYVADLIKSNNLNIELCQCNLIEKSFSLEIVPWS